MGRAPSIGFVLFVLVGGVGCGRTRALSVPNGPVVGTGGTPVAVPDSRDSGADSNAATALDASGALDATTIVDSSGAPDAMAAEPDAGTDASSSLPANRYRASALSFG